MCVSPVTGSEFLLNSLTKAQHKDIKTDLFWSQKYLFGYIGSVRNGLDCPIFFQFLLTPHMYMYELRSQKNVQNRIIFYLCIMLSYMIKYDVSFSCALKNKWE